MAHADAPLASRLNYAQCWEDVRLLTEALAPAPGRRVLSIASAGDNSLALALAGAEVDAIDLSAPQLALCRLKCAAAKLDYGDFRVLFGLDAGDATSIYRRLRSDLDTETRAYFDTAEARFAAGVLDSGRFEGYLRLFRTRILPLIHRPATVARWLELEDATARRRYWRRFANARWQALFRLFFSRTVMAARGRSREQFAHVRGPIGDALSARTERVLTTQPIRDNGYVQWILYGRYVFDEALPPWLSEAGHRQLGEAARRIRWLHAPLGDHLSAAGSRTYDAYNLSDLFEYLDHPTTAALYDGVVRAARPGARVAYWNLFVPRHRPEALADRVVRRTDDAARLYARDRAFVYGAFQVEEVVAP